MTDQLLLWWAKLEVLWPWFLGAGVLVLVVVVVVSQIRFVRGERAGMIRDRPTPGFVVVVVAAAVVIVFMVAAVVVGIGRAKGAVPP